MPRDGAIIFGDLVGKLDVLDAACKISVCGPLGVISACRGMCDAYDVDDDLCDLFRSGDGRRARTYDTWPTGGTLPNRPDRK
jgi:hypothetical protein